MADALVQLILKARDEATAKIRAVSGEMGGLAKTVNKLSGSFGIGGLGVGAIATAGAAIFGIAKAYGDAVEQAVKAGTTMGQTRAEFERSKQTVEEMNYQLALLRKHLVEVGRGDWAVGITAGTTAFLNSLSKLKGAEVLAMIARAGSAEGAARAGADFLTKTQNGKGVFWKKEAVPKELTEKEKPYRDAVADIAKAFDISTQKAEAFQNAIQRDKDLKHYQELHDLLVSIGAIKPPKAVAALQGLYAVSGADITAVPTPTRRGPPTGVERVPEGWLKTATIDLQKQNREIHEWLETMPKISAAAAALRASWKEAVAGFNADSQRLAAGGLNDTFRAWEFGAAGAADRIRNIFMSALDDLAAAAFDSGLGALLKAAGIAIGGPVGIFVGGVGTKLAGGSLAPARGVGDTIILNTSLTMPDALSQLTAHDSPLRRGMERQIQLRRAGQD